MNPKICMALLFAFVLLISPGVASRDLPTQKEQNKVGGDTNGLDDGETYGGYPGNYNGGYGGGGGGGGGGYGGGHGYGGGGGGHGYGGGSGGDSCRYGCCGGNNYVGIGCTCCSYDGEAVEDAKPPN